MLKKRTENISAFCLHSQKLNSTICSLRDYSKQEWENISGVRSFDFYVMFTT